MKLHFVLLVVLLIHSISCVRITKTITTTTTYKCTREDRITHLCPKKENDVTCHGIPIIDGVSGECQTFRSRCEACRHPYIMTIEAGACPN